MAAFLTFLWRCRGGKSWRATEADHTADLIWRRQDPAGPLISDATWAVQEIGRVERVDMLGGLIHEYRHVA